jgi:hypothetical protein
MPEPLDSEPTAAGSGDVTAVTSPMSRLALESTMADMVAWRRDAEKKLAYLESELVQLRHTAANLTAPKPDLHRDPTAPLFPEFASLQETPAAWGGNASIAPAFSAVPTPLAAPAAASPAVASPAATSPAVVSIARRAEPRQHFDLEMRPGEFLDMPSELDGSKRKRLLVGFLMFVLLAGMATLVITALASQR